MSSPKPRTPPERRLGALWSATWHALPAAITRALTAGGTALEVGCGSGLACLALAETFPEAQVVGHDPHPPAIARARELARAAALAHRLTFAVDDSTRLPRATFALVTAERLRQRHPDPRRVLNAIRNALLPEGTCLLLEALHLPGQRDDLAPLIRQAGFSRLRLLTPAPQPPLYELRR